MYRKIAGKTLIRFIMNREDAHHFFANALSFSVSNFEGPLELLLYLIQNQEMDVCDIAIKELTTQFFEELKSSDNVDIGAEFLSNASKLLLLKSRKLIPSEKIQAEEEELDLRAEMLNQLIEYYKFKEISKQLTSLEEAQQLHFCRTVSPHVKKQTTGLEEVKLEDLAIIVESLMRNAALQPKLKLEEEWDVAGKIEWLKEMLLREKKVAFDEIFSLKKSQKELIVLFLSLLELMKYQHATVINENSTWLIYAKFV